MSAHLDRDEIVSGLRADEVARHLDIEGPWRGRWMRSRRCAEMTHPGDAFGLSREGAWHCFACDKGGGLLDLIALGHGLDIKRDFVEVLKLAAPLAGVDPDPASNFLGLPPEKPARLPREPLPPLPPIADRIALAKKCAAWCWERLEFRRLVPAYLASRGISEAVLEREEIRATPLQMAQPEPGASQERRSLFWTMQPLAIVIPVRAVADGALVDLRCRRIEPAEGQPKIIGMVGGVTSSGEERGRPRQLVGCYGRPHAIDSDHVIVVEGWGDYLTALDQFPNAQVVGAVEAGSMPLVAAHVARALAARDDKSRLTIVEQRDPPRTMDDGRVVAGAADVSVNEGPNAAAKAAIRILRDPLRVGWLFCDHDALLDGKPVNDLNDLVRAGVDVRARLRWNDDPADLG